MGLLCVSKCLLVNERDLSPNHVEEFPDFSSFTDDVPYQLADIAGFYAEGDVDVEILGCVSERFNTSLFGNSDYSGNWGVTGQDWRTCLTKGIQAMTGFQPDVVEAILNPPSDAVRHALLQARLQKAIVDQETIRAKNVLDVLESLKAGRLPGFDSEIDLSCDGDDAAHDLRKGIYPEGSRVLVEIGFVHL